MSLDELSAKLGLRFPADTELLKISGESGMVDVLFAKITFGAKGWATFMLSTSLAEADFTEDKRYLLGPDVELVGSGTASLVTQGASGAAEPAST